MPQRLLIINPNSTAAVTETIRAAVRPLARADGPAIDCMDLAEGPPGIESAADAEAVVEPIRRLVVEDAPRTDAFVIACFSDPGLEEARNATNRPVLGIGEASALTALTLGKRFGVVAITEDSAARQRARYAAMGLAGRFAESVPVGLGIAAMEDIGDAAVLERLTEIGSALRERHGADVLVMGCASFGRFRTPLADALGLPVVEPVRATAAMALSALSTV